MSQVTPPNMREHRVDLGIYILRWLRVISSEEFKAGYLDVLEEGNPEKIHCWLFDMRRRGPAPADAEDWFFESYLPILFSSLTQPHHIAVLHTPDHYTHIRDAIGFDKFQEYTNGTLLTMRFFGEEQKAVEWLQMCKQV